MKKSQFEFLCANMILFGHGIKILGHAFIDELFVFVLALKSSLRPPKSSDLNSVSFPLIILISTTLSLVIYPDNILFKLKLVVIGLSLYCLVMVKDFVFEIRTITLAGFLYIALNLLFIFIEHFAFWLTEDPLATGKTLTKHHYFSLAFWQYFWTGTAYSALGIWISFLSICRANYSEKIKTIAFVSFTFVVVYQQSRIGLTFCAISFIYFFSTLTPNYRIRLVCILAVILIGDIAYDFWLKNHLTLPRHSTYWKEYLNQVFNLGYWTHGHFFTSLHSLFTIVNH